MKDKRYEGQNPVIKNSFQRDCGGLKVWGGWLLTLKSLILSNAYTDSDVLVLF